MRSEACMCSPTKYASNWKTKFICTSIEHALLWWYDVRACQIRHKSSKYLNSSFARFARSLLIFVHFAVALSLNDVAPPSSFVFTYLNACILPSPKSNDVFGPLLGEGTICLLFAFEMFMIVGIKVSNREKLFGSLDGIANQLSMTNQW